MLTSPVYVDLGVHYESHNTKRGNYVKHFPSVIACQARFTAAAPNHCCIFQCGKLDNLSCYYNYDILRNYLYTFVALENFQNLCRITESPVSVIHTLKIRFISFDPLLCNKNNQITINHVQDFALNLIELRNLNAIHHIMSNIIISKTFSYS